MRNEQASDNNLSLYSRDDVVAAYAESDYLAPNEKVIFEQIIGSGKRILDLGVGGGRTASHLAPTALEYIGSDYSAAMVEACRKNHPGLRIELVDAADLSKFEDAYFEAVIFSFNGLGNLPTHSKRMACHREVWRVLKPGGLWIFSLHHAGSLLFRPHRPLSSAILAMLKSIPRFFERFFCRAFWNGMDFIRSSTHGGMWFLLARRDRVIAEIEDAGFIVEHILGDDYPQRNIPVMTRWYYYVCRKT
jgi:SAM-dependent methyltransferase